MRSCSSSVVSGRAALVCHCGAVKFSTFRVEAKAAGGIVYGYDGLSDEGLIEWVKKEGESGWFLFLTAAGRAALGGSS
jgi:hypothetical protein